MPASSAPVLWDTATATGRDTRSIVPARLAAGGCRMARTVAGLAEMRQRRWELRRAYWAATRLAELLEIAGRRSDYHAVREIEARLLIDIRALEGSDDAL